MEKFVDVAAEPVFILDWSGDHFWSAVSVVVGLSALPILALLLVIFASVVGSSDGLMKRKVNRDQVDVEGLRRIRPLA